MYLDPYLVILLDLDQDPHQGPVDLDQFTFKPKVKQNHTFPESFINCTVQQELMGVKIGINLLPVSVLYHAPRDTITRGA
jgi:hypothetical protein